MRQFHLVVFSCILFTFLSNGFGKDITQIGLPEHAKSRIGIGNAYDVSYSPDGTLLAVASTIGIWLYETETYKPLTLLRGHTASVLNVEFSTDGKTLASGSHDHTIRIWDPKNHQMITVLKGHQKPITDITISPDKKTLASFGYRDNSVQLWNTESGQTIGSLTEKITGVVSIAFSPEGKIIAVGDVNGEVLLYSTKTKANIASLIGHVNAPSDIDEPGSVTSLAFSPDGKTLASGSRDTTIRLWNTKTARHIVTLRGHTGRITTIVFSSDGNTIASGASSTHWSSDTTIQLWDAKTGRNISSIETQNRNYSLAFSPDNVTLASIGSYSYVSIWKINTGKLKTKLKAQQKQSIPKRTYTDGDNRIYRNDDGTYRLLNIETNEQKPILIDFNSSINRIKFSPDGKLLAIPDDRTIWLWDVQTDTLRATLTDNTYLLSSIKFSPDGNFLSTATRNSVNLWNTKTGGMIATYMIESSSNTFKHEFSTDSKLLATPIQKGKMIQMWDSETGHPQFLLLGHDREVTAILFSSDGNTIISRSYEKVILWEAKTGKRITTIKSPKGYNLSLQFSPDEKILVGNANSSDSQVGKNTIWIWDPKTGLQLNTLNEHEEAVTSVQFAPDNKTLVSGSFDKTIRFWNVETGQLLTTFKGYKPRAPITISPDGRLLACGSENAKVLVWDIRSGELKKSFNSYNPVQSIIFSDDVNTLTTKGADGTTLLWDLQEKNH